MSSPNGAPHILHFFKTSLPESIGGVEVFIDGLCRGLSERGIRSTVVALSTKPANQPLEMDGYQVIQLQQTANLASTGFSWQAFQKFSQLAATADLIHYHFPNPFADMLHFFCKVKRPALVTYHADIVKQKWLRYAYAPLMHAFLRAMSRIIATSPNYLASSRVLQRYRENVQVIPLALPTDPPAIPPPSVVAHWRNRLPTNFFLFIGALRYYKGLEYAIAAFTQSNYHLVIAGSGAAAAALQQQARDLPNVHFLGAVDDSLKTLLLQRCDAFLFPSHVRAEAFGIALLEAARAGKPMITCELKTGTSYVNRHHQTGLVVPPASPPALRQACQQLAEDPALRQQFGAQARTRFLKHFTLSQQTQAYFDLYHELLSS